MKKLLLVPLMAVAWLCACRQEPLPQEPPFVPIDYTVLPPDTQEGKNTFGCLVNGEVWVPRVPIFAVTIYDKAISFDESKGLGYGYGTFRLVDAPIDDWMSLSFGFTFFEPSVFHTTPDGSDSSLFRVKFQRGNSGYYKPDYSVPLASNTWKVTKVDTVNNFISGTFEFTLIDETNPNDTLKFTEGRFDLLYYSQ